MSHVKLSCIKMLKIVSKKIITIVSYVSYQKVKYLNMDKICPEERIRHEVYEEYLRSHLKHIFAKS